MAIQVRIARNEEEARIIQAGMTHKGLQLADRSNTGPAGERVRMTFLPGEIAEAAEQRAV